MSDELTDFHQQWTKAELAGDTAKLEQMLHPDFVAVGPLGFVLNKSQWLARLTSGDLKYKTLTWEEPASRFFGDTAITVAAQQSEAAYKDFEMPSARYRATAVSIREDGAWTIAGFQLSQIAGPPPGVGGPPRQD